MIKLLHQTVGSPLKRAVRGFKMTENTNGCTTFWVTPQVISLQPLWGFWDLLGSEDKNEAERHSKSLIVVPHLPHDLPEDHCVSVSLRFVSCLNPRCSSSPHPSVISQSSNRYLLGMNCGPVIWSKRLVAQGNKTDKVSVLLEFACFQWRPLV